MTTLQDALTNGRGTERPFNCPVHDDRNASASVNVLKGVWVCYACNARGRVDAPLEIDPDDLVRQVKDLLSDTEISPYPESWLTLYTGPCEYWEKRFSYEAIEHFQLGFDPVKEEPCYPLRAPNGKIHGLVHRNSDYSSKRKYKYPYGVSIQNYLFNYTPARRSTAVLVEGAADAIALWEVGIEAFAIYGTRPSRKQIQLVLKTAPDLVVCAFDQDKAGRRAAYEVIDLINGLCPVSIAVWDDNDGKDPAELIPEQRTSYIGSLIQ
jgi:DNA primase